MQKSYSKIIFLASLLILGLSLFTVGETFAYLDDDENLENNIYSAGSLDFSLSSSGDFSPSTLNPEESATRTINVINNGSLPFQYNISTVKIAGDDDFCSALKLEAKLEGAVKYSNGLMRLNVVPPVVIGSDNQDDWLFTITLPSDVPSTLQNKTCQFKFIFDGWQVDFNDSSEGFSDSEEISNNIQSGQWLPKIVINEVYYDPDEEHGGANAEWIELYNAGDNVVNLKDWYFKNDSNSTETINQTYNINPGQFVVVAANASMWNTYWDLIPSNAVKIALGGQKLFYGLKNDGDHIALFDSKDNEIDAMSWGSDTYAFDPSCPDVAKGHSLARSPKGYDTDSPSDFVDNPNPNPGTNPHDVISEGSRETNIDKNTPPDIKEDNKEEGVSNNPDEETQSNEEDSHDEPAVDNKEDILEELLESENQDSGEGNDGDGETENSNPAPKPVDAIQAPE